MRDHPRPQALMEYVTNALSTSERTVVEAHLHDCPSCRGMVALERKSLLGEELKTSPVTNREGSTGLENTVIRVPVPFADEKTVTDPPQPLDPEALVGARVGDYILEELVGRGGMAAVYRATQPVIGKRVAVKVMLARADDGDFAARMIQEARTVTAIEHPNIVEVLSAGSLSDGRPYLVMQFLEGVSLAQWVRKQAVDVPARTIIGLLSQLFSALSAAHQAGVIHRDIKPANVMLTQLHQPVPTVKVVDFGLAKSRNPGVTTKPNVVMGTPGYVSPEQIMGQPATPASDLYSAGLVAHFLATRTDAFKDHTHALTTLHLQLKGPPPPIQRAGLPTALIELVAQLTRVDPRERPQSAAQVVTQLKALEGVLQSTGWSTATTEPISEPSAPSSVRTVSHRALRPAEPALAAQPGARSRAIGKYVLLALAPLAALAAWFLSK